MTALDDVSTEAFCYLTTRGRVTGDPHEIEIWFALRDSTVYLLAGGGRTADWVKNILAAPEVKVRVGSLEMSGHGRLVEDADEEAWARSALLDKYDPTYAGDLTGWSQNALPVAVDLIGAGTPWP